MKSFTYTVQDELGLHARPAGLLAKLAAGCTSTITIDNGTKKADAKRLMAIMSMGVQRKSVIFQNHAHARKYGTHACMKAHISEHVYDEKPYMSKI